VADPCWLVSSVRRGSRKSILYARKFLDFYVKKIIDSFLVKRSFSFNEHSCCIQSQNTQLFTVKRSKQSNSQSICSSKIFVNALQSLSYDNQGSKFPSCYAMHKPKSSSTIQTSTLTIIN
jgi:hypothetical protein